MRRVLRDISFCRKDIFSVDESMALDGPTQPHLREDTENLKMTELNLQIISER